MSAALGELRLPAPRGSLIERDRPLAFSFDGRRYGACQGDTIASALAAHGVRVLSRSFKYHRPRGILGLHGTDGNVLVQVGDEPNVRADLRRVEDGMVVTAQNVIGSLARDWGRLIERCSRFLPVGFYYHAFHRPRWAWRHWEPAIRRLAGLGRVDVHALPPRADKRYWHTDVAVVGGGAAGLAAALAAAEAGAEVLLIEDGVRLGGALNHVRFAPDATAALDLLGELVEAVAAADRIRVLPETRVTGGYADNWLAAIDAREFHQVRAGAVVVATGVHEQPAVFAANDLPGIMFGSAAQRLLHDYGVKPGRRAVALVANAEGYGVALDLMEAGVEVAAVIDLHARRDGEPLREAVLAAGIEVLSGAVVQAAHADGTGLALGAIDVGGAGAAGARRIECDLLTMSVGFSPAAQLVCQLGGSLRYDTTAGGLRVVPPGNAHRVECAGALAGHFDLDAALADGRRAGRRAAARDAAPDPAGVLDQFPAGRGRNHAWPLVPSAGGRDFVDFDEDIQVADLEQTVAAGYADFDLAKRYSTVVMGPSQGRHSALNALRIVTRARGADLEGVTITTQRPPIFPEPIAHLAGRPWHPLRVTALHAAHLALGAQMTPAGSWLRPAHYGAPGSARESAQAEARAVREAVGLIDVSTLGKIEVHGPDAAEFLERFYTFRYRKQAVGKLRYVLMTDEAGVIADDGVAARFGEQFYYVSATTTGADAVYRQMLRWNAQWNLDVTFSNVTSAYAGINVAGPAARELLQPLVDDLDLGARACAFQDCREARIGGLPARLLRVGFVGELGWEVHVPAACAAALWTRLLSAGRALGVRPVGIEAQRLLRLEKGHLIVSQDTDGLTHPREADMQWAIADEKPYFVGQRALAALARRPLTRQLVGFALEPNAPLPEECNLTMRGRDIVGRVTSVAWSASCGRGIGLAYVAPEQAVPGSEIEIKLSGRARRVHAEVVPRPFYDPDNARQAL